MYEELKPESPVIISDTKRKLIAVEFRAVFDDFFNEAEEARKEDFILEKSLFDEFVVDSGFCSFVQLPETGTADWIKFRHESNTARYELNSASEVGVHGEPPYRIDNNSKTTLKVRLLASIVKLTHTLMVNKIESLVESKSQGFKHMTEYLTDISDELPVALQSEIASQKKMFNMTINNVTHMLQQYVVNVTETYEKATQLRLDDKS